MSEPQRRRRRAENAMVPDAEFTSYYGRPIVKPAVWKVPDVPAYLFLGGMAGASATMGAMADVTGRHGLRRVGRLAAALGSIASVCALMHDLGRPERFLNMLRVFKPTSPLSVGSWILAPFTALSAGVAASEMTGVLPRSSRVAGAVAGGLGPVMTVYTAVLLADTATPAWHEAHRELPFVFAGSALASAGAVGMLAAPLGERGPAQRMAALGGALELAASARLEEQLGDTLAEPYRRGRSGRVLKIARILTGVGVLAAAIPGDNRRLATTAAAALTCGAVGTRYGIFAAGITSATDPKYTVLPQRGRIDAGEQG